MKRALISLFVLLGTALACGRIAVMAQDRNAAPNYTVRPTPGSIQENTAGPMVPDLAFTDSSGAVIHLSHFRGQVVLINFWATWCGPCVAEMAALDQLQGTLKGEPLVTLPISEDRGGIPVAKTFFTRQKISYLKPYADPSGATARSLGIDGLPTSLIVDKQGRLVTRVSGPYEWDSPQIVARFRELTAAR